jgi:hypothetical protein
MNCYGFGLRIGKIGLQQTMMIGKLYTLSAALVLLFPCAAHAGDDLAYDGNVYEEAKAILANHDLGRPLGKGTLYPIFNISLGYRTDVFEEGKKKAAPEIRWRGGGGYQGENNGHLYGVEALVEDGAYLTGENDADEMAQLANVYWGTSVTPRHHLDLGVQLQKAYDPRGEEDPLQNSRHTINEAEPDKWTELQGGGTYQLGVKGARGRAELGACITCKEFDNNGQSFRDRDDLDLGGTLFVRVAPRTELFGQVVYTDIDYVNQTLDDPIAGRDMDSEEWRYMVGASWNISKKSKGIFRIGQVDKEFTEQSGRDDYSELSWDALFNWQPTSRDSFELGFFRSPQEPLIYEEDYLTLQDDVIEVEQVNLSWSRNWGRRLSSSMDAYRGWDSYQPSGRNDDRMGYSFGASYTLAKWGAIGIRFYHRERDAELGGHDYSDDGVDLYFNIGEIFGFGLGNSRAPSACGLRGFAIGRQTY